MRRQNQALSIDSLNVIGEHMDDKDKTAKNVLSGLGSVPSAGSLPAFGLKMV